MKEFSQQDIEFVISSLKKIANRRKWTQAQIAQESGIAQSTVSKIFSGEIRPTDDLAKKLCKALGLRFEDILKSTRGTDREMCGYLATPLTSLGDEKDDALRDAVSKIRGVAHSFNSPKIELYWPGEFTHPKLNPGLTAEQVYLTDRSRASTHDFIVLFCGAPSFGVGQENEIATQVGLPAIRLVPQSRISRMMTGSFLRAIEVPFAGSLETRVEIDADKLHSAFESMRTVFFKHQAHFRNLHDGTFGSRLERLIQERSGSYGSFAEDLGITLACLHALIEEPLPVSNPSSQLLKRMASLLSTTVGHLLGEADETDPVWIESHAAWRRWVDGAKVDASLALSIQEEWGHEYRLSQSEPTNKSFRRSSPPLTETDWQKRYEDKLQRSTANAAGPLFRQRD